MRTFDSYWHTNLTLKVSLKVCSYAVHHDIQEAPYSRNKQIKRHQNRVVHKPLSAFSRFVPRETDRCVHLEDIIMACMPTIGDRRVTGVCALCPAACFSVSHLHLVAFGETYSTDRSNNEAFQCEAYSYPHTHTSMHTGKPICRNVHKNTCTGTCKPAQPQGKCHSYTPAKEWSLQGDMKLKDQLCAEP